MPPLLPRLLLPPLAFSAYDHLTPETVRAAYRPSNRFCPTAPQTAAVSLLPLPPLRCPKII